MFSTALNDKKILFWDNVLQKFICYGYQLQSLYKHMAIQHANNLMHTIKCFQKQELALVHIYVYSVSKIPLMTNNLIHR